MTGTKHIVQLIFDQHLHNPYTRGPPTIGSRLSHKNHRVHMPCASNNDRIAR
jgi:hypothetical protein